MRHLLAFISLLLFSAMCSGQTNHRQGKDYALFFAVNDYNSMQDLNNPIQNATDIAKELRDKYGFKTEVVENPTLDEIEEKLSSYEKLFTSNTFDQNGQLLLFFTGHGMTRGPNGYFMPADADPERAHRTGLEYDHWRNEINNIACKHILVVIDACYSISFDEKWPARPDRLFGPPGRKEIDQVLQDHNTYRTRRYFTSDAKEDQTPDRSTLAYQFLRGLRSYQTFTGYLTADELFSNYLRKGSPTPGSGKFGNNQPDARFLFFQKQLPPIPVDARADLAAWQTAQQQNDCAGYRTYLAKFSSGDFVATARRKVASCEAEERMLAAWQIAKARNDCDTYTAFTKDYPQSPYAGLVPDRLKALNCGRVAVPNNMIFIPGGTFQMGDQFGDGADDEKPVHTVTLSSFYLGRTEITVGDFADFIEATDYFTKGEKEEHSDIFTNSWRKINGVSRLDDTKGNSRLNSEYNHAVVHVNWYDAVAYCNWLSGQYGLNPAYRVSNRKVTPDWSANGYRLPTEAEWEYAARSGGKKEKWAGTSIESSLSQFANCYVKENNYQTKNPVGVLRLNDLGLADMSGNVWEWCWDWYDSDYYKKSPDRNPSGPNSGVDRVVRGGSWGNDSSRCRAANRDNFRPSYLINMVGFRIARSL